MTWHLKFTTMRKKQTSFLDREIVIDLRVVAFLILVAFIIHYFFMRHLTRRLKYR